MIFFIAPLLTAAITVLLLLVLQPIATRTGLLDFPNERSSHHEATPLVGGLAIFFGVTVGSVAAVSNGLLPADIYGLSLFTGCLLLVVVGVIDDLHPLSASLRFLLQIGASLIMIYGGGVVLTDLGAMLPSGATLNLGEMAVPFTVFATLGVINAINMCDGLDGLSGTLSLVSLTGMLIAASVGGRSSDAIVLALLASAIVAFLLFNLRIGGRQRATVFLGDAGSTTLGFVLTWFAISLSQGDDRAITPAVALWFIMLPIFDTVAMMFRRLLRGRSPFSPDREHIHHVFLLAGFSVNETVTVMAAAALIGVGIGLLSMDIQAKEFYVAGFFLIAGILYFWMVLRAWRVMRFIERSINRRRRAKDRRAGRDRRQQHDPSFAGPERRSGMDRRATARREEDHGLKALESGRRVTTRLQPRQSR
jgi:UDP-GlcNAc:undecaprenyl-phosphate GlcNAc-1-phosphate transferase